MVQFWEKLSYILPPLAFLELLAAEYLSETNLSNFIYHLLMITCSLDALKKVFEEERYENRKGKTRGLTTNYTAEKGLDSKRSG